MNINKTKAVDPSQQDKTTIKKNPQEIKKKKKKCLERRALISTEFPHPDDPRPWLRQSMTHEVKTK